MRSLGSFVVLLLGSIATWLTPPAGARGRFVLGAKLPDFSELISRALNIPWLGPGLVVAFVLAHHAARGTEERPTSRFFAQVSDAEAGAIPGRDSAPASGSGDLNRDF